MGNGIFFFDGHAHLSRVKTFILFIVPAAAAAAAIEALDACRLLPAEAEAG